MYNGMFFAATLTACIVLSQSSRADELSFYSCSDFVADAEMVSSQGLVSAGTNALYGYAFVSGAFFGATGIAPQQSNPELEHFIEALFVHCQSRLAESALTEGINLARKRLESAPSESADGDVLDRVDPPSQQDAFNLVVSDYRDAYNGAENEMVAGGQRQKRAKALCKILTGTKVSNWVGFITRLSSTNDGRGVLSIETGKGVTVSTWNNTLSDIGDNTLLSIDNPVFEVAMGLQVGQAVEFSGSFLPDKRDCIREGSLTQSGSMKSPTFIMRFTSLKQLGGAYQPAKSSSKKTPRRKSLLLQRLEGG